MTLFWAICAVLLMVALLFVVLPLWRSAGKKNDILRDAANLEILRDQSAELEADLRNGLLTHEAYEQGKRELQARLLEEVKDIEQPVRLSRNPAKVLAMVLVGLIPLFSVLLYLKTGSTNAILYAGSPENMGPEAALQELEKKVARDPQDPNSLVMLARSYAQLKRFPDAARAYGQLVKLVPEEPQAWAEYADAYAMVNNRSLLGEPEKFISKALELDGNNMLALDLSGAVAMQRGDYVIAITQWQKMMGLLPPNARYADTLRESIQQARGLLAQEKGGREKLAKLPKMPERPAAGAESISGKVSLSPALAAKAAPEDVIYIFARDAQGKKGPLAAMRIQVKDLPLQFTLDDSMAMQPQAKLSSAGQVTVVARVSKSGSPAPQSGDLQGARAAVKPGSNGVNIVIDTVVP